MPTRRVVRRGTVRVKRKVIDKDTVGITVTPVKPVRKAAKRKS